jgi:hypothetical protein
MIKKFFLGILGSRRRTERSFLDEVRSNLEHVLVMEQRQNVSIRLDHSSVVPCGYEDYAKSVEEYNVAFDDHQQYASMYKADVAAQTRERAAVLDGKYEVLLKRFAVLKDVITSTLDKLKGNARA